jgi:AraC-like DNA-binding protein
MNGEYTRHQISNIISIHKIAILNFFEFKKEFAYKGERHNFWEMAYVERGQLTVEAEGKTFVVSEGECIFHKPQEFHVHKATKDSETSYFVVGFICNSPYMQVFRGRHFRLSQKLCRFLVNILDEAKNVFDIPFNNPSNQRLKISDNALIGGQQMIRTYLEQFLILLVRQNYNITSSPSQTKEEEIVAKIKNKFDLLLYNKVNIDEVCREMNYSRTYLSKIFLSLEKMTMGEYVTNIKIEEAKTLIRSESYNFTQISDLLSFSNPLYFSRVFKKAVGMSPSEYKKSVMRQN